jgi:KipI family sensor histidine kinase inhibitor
VIQPFGDRALLVEVRDYRRAHALVASLDGEPAPGVVDVVPGMETVLVELESSASAGRASAELERRLASLRVEASGGRERTIPTCYGAEHGADLDDVARLTGLSPEEVAAAHAAATTLEVQLIGFAPGFAYIGDLPDALRVPRLETPRTTTPPGSVAVAASHTGIYPAALPGGWRVIGRTPITLFDPRRDPPSYLAPGDRVRFRAIDPGAWAVHRGPPGDWSARSAAGEVTEPSVNEIKVLEGGLLTTVQDPFGRPGWRRYGVQAAGALDPDAAATANRLAGNPAAAALLEITVLGPTVRLATPARVGLAGADLGAVIDGRALAPGSSAVGSQIHFGGRRSGARAYLAVAGGIAVPSVLGSRSTDLRSGFGGFEGRALRAGDRLPIGVGDDAQPTARPAAPVRFGPIHVLPGPHPDRFSAGALERLCETEWTASSRADRMAYRLDGPPIERQEMSELPSLGLPLGAVQVPPDGGPIVMLADRPVTGGYPVIACVARADIGRVAQLLPGDPVRFTLAGDDGDAAWAGALE